MGNDSIQNEYEGVVNLAVLKYDIQDQSGEVQSRSDRNGNSASDHGCPIGAKRLPIDGVPALAAAIKLHSPSAPARQLGRSLCGSLDPHMRVSDTEHVQAGCDHLTIVSSIRCGVENQATEAQNRDNWFRTSGFDLGDAAGSQRLGDDAAAYVAAVKLLSPSSSARRTGRSLGESPESKLWTFEMEHNQAEPECVNNCSSMRHDIEHLDWKARSGDELFGASGSDQGDRIFTSRSGNHVAAHTAVVRLLSSSSSVPATRQSLGASLEPRPWILENAHVQTECGHVPSASLTHRSIVDQGDTRSRSISFDEGDPIGAEMLRGSDVTWFAAGERLCPPSSAWPTRQPVQASLQPQPLILEKENIQCECEHATDSPSTWHDLEDELDKAQSSYDWYGAGDSDKGDPISAKLLIDGVAAYSAAVKAGARAARVLGKASKTVSGTGAAAEQRGGSSRVAFAIVFPGNDDVPVSRPIMPHRRKSSLARDAASRGHELSTEAKLSLARKLRLARTSGGLVA